jgi:hypothetical protein
MKEDSKFRKRLLGILVFIRTVAAALVAAETAFEKILARENVKAGFVYIVVRPFEERGRIGYLLNLALLWGLLWFAGIHLHKGAPSLCRMQSAK